MIELPEMPRAIAKLPRDDRGYPVPWFVAWIEGKPEFRCADGRKMERAIKQHLCWVCGERITHDATFVIGPMCAVNRTTAEPPCHYTCAEFAAKACPFLTKPRACRREAGLPEGDTAGVPIKRNPGCCLLWVCRTREAYSLFSDSMGGFLFHLPEPNIVFAFAEGREATREEVMASMESGLPILREIAEKDGPADVALLERMYADAMRFVPAACGLTEPAQ